MKKLSKFSDKKIKLNKKQQFRILEFFLNTSVPPNPSYPLGLGVLSKSSKNFLSNSSIK